MNFIQSVWEGTPPWVGLLLLVLLVSYALVRAGYELWREEEQARKKAQAQLQNAEQERKVLKGQTQQLIAENQRLSTENEQLKVTREKLYQQLQDRRREVIEYWRSVIADFDFDSPGYFTSTRTYSEMREHLKPEAIQKLEDPRTFIVPNEAGGDSIYKQILLDEVTRIEREEWELI
jgi:hypothetical protein